MSKWKVHKIFTKSTATKCTENRPSSRALLFKCRVVMLIQCQSQYNEMNETMQILGQLNLYYILAEFSFVS